MRLVAALFGSSILEIVHWYDLREHLSQKKVAALLRSRGYWLLTVIMAVAGAVGALLMGSNLNTGQVVVFAAAFPTVFKKVVATFKPSDLHLGAEEASLSDYFT